MELKELAVRMRRSAVVLAILAIAGCGSGELSREQAEQIAHDRLDNDLVQIIGVRTEGNTATARATVESIEVRLVYSRDDTGWHLDWVERGNERVEPAQFTGSSGLARTENPVQPTTCHW